MTRFITFNDSISFTHCFIVFGLFIETGWHLNSTQ